MGAVHARLEVCADLWLPRRWVVAPSPDHAAAEHFVIASLTPVASSDRAQRALQALRPGALGASMFPSARRSALSSLSLLCAAWAFYDDRLEATGRPDPEVSQALRTGVAPDRASPLVRAFARAGSGFGGRSAGWRTRFMQAFDATVATVAQEAELRRDLATTGLCPAGGPLPRLAPHQHRPRRHAATGGARSRS